MMAKGRIEWLYRELPGLVSSGILDQGAADRLRAHYAGLSKRDYGRTLLTVFGAIGTILVFLGAITLMAFNWEALPRWVRVASAFGPLLCAQGVAFFAYFKTRESAPWRECACLALMLGYLACAGILSQIYHIKGGAEGLLLSAALVSLPFVYVFRSNAGALGYLACVTLWAAFRQSDGAEALLYWPLILAIVPRLYLSIRKERYGNSAVYLGWVMALSLCVGMGISLEKTMPGLWIVVYAAFFGCLRLLGTVWFDASPSPARNPFGAAGFLGAYSLAFLLTYTWPWEDIGWRYARSGGGYLLAAGAVDYLVLGLLFAAFLFLAFIAIRGKKPAGLPQAILPLVCLGGYLLKASLPDTGEVGTADLAIHLALNASLLAAGVFHIIHGFKEKKITEINSGTLIICLLICLRFIFVEGFFEDMIFRGLIFILTGGLFLGANLVISKHLAKGART